MSALAIRILSFIDSNGRRLVDIADHVGADAAAVAAEVDRLRSRGLVFDAGERMIGRVVMPLEHAEEHVPLAAAAAKTLPVVAAAAG